jgi:uncharacterized protein (TIGR00730 family)
MEDTEKIGGVDNRPFRPKKMTLDDIRNGCISLYGKDDNETQICVMNEELRQGIDSMVDLKKSITIFGSARTPESDEFYQKAVRIAERAGHAGFATVTGGGPGIMQAGNEGAHRAHAESVGMTIKLPMEQVTNPFVTNEVPFYFFFTRKTAMRFGSKVFLFFPGGFGTLDELCESLTLIQTKKIDNVPLILVGTEFWKPFDQFIRNQLVDRKLIGADDINLYTITDDEDEVMEIIMQTLSVKTPNI